MRGVLQKEFYKIYIGVLLLLYGSMFINAQEVFQDSGYAIGGYDTVAYFTHAKPIKGNKTFSVVWHNAIWLFSKKDNKRMFEDAPQKYAPQYGGHCSYAMAQNTLLSADPTVFTITNGKLYLNYSMPTKMDWEKYRKENIKKADKYWIRYKKKLRK